jgi:hypothetical protein
VRKSSSVDVFDLTGSSRLNNDDGVSLPAHPGKRNYLFHAGDSTEIRVRVAFRVSANTKAETLERARAVANQSYDGTYLIKALAFLNDNQWLDSVRIYLDGRCMHLRNGFEE